MSQPVVADASDTAQHYAETIFYIRFEEGRVRPSRIADWLGLSAPTVTVTLQRLARDGWVELAKDHSVTLTARGDQLATRVVRVHRLLERWLVDTLGFDWASADGEAQSLAPGVTADLADRLDASLGNPQTCPHGNVIPGREPPYGRLIPLADLPNGSRAVIRRISEVAEHDAPELLRDLDARGMRTGTKVFVGSDMADEDIAVDVGGQHREVSRDVGRLIWVEPAG